MSRYLMGESMSGNTFLILAILASLLPTVLEGASSSSSSSGNNDPDGENAVKNAPAEVTTEAAVAEEAASKCPNFCGNGACDEQTGKCSAVPSLISICISVFQFATTVENSGNVPVHLNLHFNLQF